MKYGGIFLMLSIVLGMSNTVYAMKKDRTLKSDVTMAEKVEKEAWYGDFSIGDREFYQAVHANTLDPLKEFCKQYSAYAFEYNKIMNADKVALHQAGTNQDQILTNFGDNAHRGFWWDGFVSNNFRKDGPCNLDTKEYHIPDLVIAQDTKNPIAGDQAARFNLIWPYLRDTQYGRETWLSYAKDQGNTTIQNFLQDTKKSESVISQNQWLSVKIVCGIAGVAAIVALAVAGKYIYEWYIKSADDKSEISENSDTHEHDAQNVIPA